MADHEFFKQALERHKAGDLKAAEALYKSSIAQNPDHAPSYGNLAMVHSAQCHDEVALSLSRIASRLDPSNPIYHSNVGKALWSLERYEEAEVACRTALRLDGNFAEALHNMGAIAFATERPNDAIGWFDAALDSDPNRENTKWDRAWALLATGDFKHGLQEYELRWNRVPKAKIWDSGIPEWKGEDLTGKHIVVHHEQGYGDTLNFVRFALSMKHVYPRMRLTIAVPMALLRLMTECAEADEIAVWELEKSGDAYNPRIDFHSPMISIMRWLPRWKITGSPYFIPVPPAMMGIRDERFAVGVVWSAAATGMQGHYLKSMDPLHLAPLAELPGVQLYGLQKAGGLDELYETGMDSLIQDLSGRISDFYDLARAMAAMDVVVSVDTAPLHLAGALGIPAIGLIPYARCWRWPRGDTKTTPWYNSVHLEAQSKPGDWAGVIERVAARITELQERK